MLITKDEVKQLLQIASTDTTKDELIVSLIVKAQEFIVRRINSFFMPGVYAYGSTFSFDATDNSINDSESSFDVDGFAEGNDIIVLGSYQNTRVFEIKEISASKIILTDDVKVKNEASVGQDITIQRVDFSEDIKLAAADFIASKLRRSKDVKSESIGDYSATYLTDKEMLTVFSPFKKMQWT